MSQTYSCPHCGSENICINVGNKWNCRNCKMEFEHPILKTANSSATIDLVYQKNGWICPVCGAGVNPNEKVCPCYKLNHNSLITVNDPFIYSPPIIDTVPTIDDSEESELQESIKTVLNNSHNLKKKKTAICKKKSNTSPKNEKKI